MEPIDAVKADIQRMSDEWPFEYVLRAEIEKFTHGIIKRGTIQKMDSEGRGIERFYWGRKACYRKQDVVDFLVARIRKDYAPDARVS